MGVIMRAALMAICFAIGILMAAILLVDVVNAKEPTTLEDALERPVVVHRHFDEATGVACFWTDRYPKYLSCVQVYRLGFKKQRTLNDLQD
jgi:hypothetical protein